MHNKKIYLKYNLILLYILSVLFLIFLPIDNVFINIFKLMFFLFVPGYLFLGILKISSTNSRRLIYSLGLSIVFLIVVGLFLNYILHSSGIHPPLNSIYFNLSYLLIVGIFLFFAFIRNKDHSTTFPFDLNLKSADIFLLTLSSTILLFTIYSSLYMRSQNVNTFVALSYIFVFVFSVIILALFKKLNSKLIPIYVLVISISLTIPSILRYNFIAGVDVFRSYQLYEFVNQAGYWEVFTDQTNLMASTSINFFPVVIQRLTGFSGMTTFTILIPLIFSMSTLSVYEISKKLLDSSSMALIGALFYCSGLYFTGIGSPRTSLAVFLLSIVIVTFLDEKTNYLQLTFLFVFFSIGVILTHYSTAYIFLFILLIFLFFKLSNKFLGLPEHNFLSKFKISHFLSYLIILYLWFNYIIGETFESGVVFVYRLFTRPERGEAVQAAVEAGTSIEHPILSVFSYIVNWSAMIIIAIGTILLFKDVIFKKSKIKENNQFILSVAGGVILFFFFVLPYVSIGYGLSRAYILSAILIAPTFVLGCFLLLRKNYKFSQILAICLVGMFFLNHSGVSRMMVNEHPGMVMQVEGDRYLEMYISEGESKSALWLYENKGTNTSIHTTGLPGDRRLEISFNQDTEEFKYIRHNTNTLPHNFSETTEGYIYLYGANVENQKRFERLHNQTESGYYIDFESYEDWVLKSNKIYSNGNSEILYN